MDPGLHPDVLAGARLHRRVDAFTDTHPVFARSRALFRDGHGRYSAILTDLFYDHVLARDWHRYHDQPLDRFIDQAHAALAEGFVLMPGPMRPIVARLIDQGVVALLRERGGDGGGAGDDVPAFHRASGPAVDLVSAVADWPEISEALADDFDAFFHNW